MPIEVDERERLVEIARATLVVARERGTRGVTLRAVAEQLGRSTAFITNFVPSRASLMVNALQLARTEWSEDRASKLEGESGLQRLVALARWMCTTSPEDNTLRALWVEVIADVRGVNREAYDVLRALTDSTYSEFLGSAEEADREEGAAIADILYLYCRGFHVKAVEDPEAWTDQRVNAALDTLLRKLLGFGAAPELAPIDLGTAIAG